MIDQHDLKPCPFCGGKGILKDRFVQGANNKAYWIVCGKCQARIQDRRSRKRAIEAWNNRESEEVLSFLLENEQAKNKREDNE